MMLKISQHSEKAKFPVSAFKKDLEMLGIGAFAPWGSSYVVSELKGT